MRSLLACALMIAVLRAPAAWAGLEAMPTRIDIDRFTCRDLLALDPQLQERALVYLTGVLDGRRRSPSFDANVAGAAIERLLVACRATPSLVAVDAFIAAWP
jgi:hypothetical protein